MAIVAAVFFIAGLSSIAIAGYSAWSTEQFLNRCMATEGKITGLVPIVRSNSDQHATRTTYAPTFSFTAADGMTYSVTSTSSSNPPEFEVGDSIIVLYEASSPDQARIDSFGQLWLASIIFGGVGAIFFVISIGMAFYLRALSRRPSAVPPLIP